MNTLWGKLIKKSKTIKNHVIEIDEIDVNRKSKIEHALADMCVAFDLERPMWLSDNEKDFNQFNKTSFSQMHFIEEIDFDRLEIELIIEKKKKQQS